MGWITDLLQELPLSAIQRERLSLAEQKYALLETKQSDIEVDNKTLRLNIEKAEIEIQNLKKLTEKSHSNHLEKVKEEMLQLLAANPDVTEEQLSRAMNIGTQLVMFHLAELENTSLVHGSYSAIEPTSWSLAHEGRAYLVTHGLLA